MMAPFTQVTAELSKDLAVLNKYMRKHAAKFPDDVTPDMSKIPKQATTVLRAINGITESIEKLHKDLGKGDINNPDKPDTAKTTAKRDRQGSTSDTDDFSEDDDEYIDDEESVLSKIFFHEVDEDGEDCLTDVLGITDYLPRDCSPIEYHVLAAKMGIHDADYMLQVLRLATVKWGILSEPYTGWLSHNWVSLLFPTSIEKKPVDNKPAKTTTSSGSTSATLMPKTISTVAKISSASASSRASSQQPLVLTNPIRPSSPAPARPKSSIATVPGAGLPLLLRGFYWNTLSAGRTVVVLSHTRDNISIHLAHHAKHLRFTNLIPATHTAAGSPPPANSAIGNLEHKVLSAGIRWSTPADVVLLRRVLGRRTDEECVSLFRRLITFLRPGDIVLINDVALGGTGYEEDARSTRRSVGYKPAFDERTVQDYLRLLAAVDARFYVSSFAKATEDEGMSLFTVAWTG